MQKKEKVVYNFIKLLIATNEEEIKKVGENLMSEEESNELAQQVSDLSSEIKYIGFPDAYDSDEEYWEDVMRERVEAEKEASLKHGIEQGSTQKQIEVAKKMLEKNMSIEDIIEITNLTKEEIETL